MPHGSLKVLHTISTLDPKLGSGPADALSRLVGEQARQGMKATVITVDAPGAIDSYVKPLRDLGVTILCTGPARSRLMIGPTTKETVRRVLQDVNVVHIHAIWQYLPHTTASLARKAGVPYIMRPAGMLEPHALTQGRLRKTVHLFLKGRRDMKGAAVVHATAPMEARNLAALGFGNPLLVVPNGVDLHDYLTTERNAQVEARWPDLAGHRRVLFMGRVDPIKGTMNLAQAWGRLSKQFPDWRLVIAGPDWRGHQAQFEAALSEHGGRATTTFVGAVYGDDKRNLLASCDFMVQPSFQENFGITIAESLASARPVITTKGTPWHVLETRKIGRWIDVGAEPLYEAMRGEMSRPRSELDEMGKRGRSLMEEEYSWSSIAAHHIAAYQWLRSAGPKPEYVYAPGTTIPD